MTEETFRFLKFECLLNTALFAAHAVLLSMMIYAIQLPHIQQRMLSFFFVSLALCWALVIVCVSIFALLSSVIEAHAAKFVSGSLAVRLFCGVDLKISAGSGMRRLAVKLPSLSAPFVRSGFLFAGKRKILVVTDRLPNYQEVISYLSAEQKTG